MADDTPESRPISTDDLRMAGAVIRADVTKAFLADNGALTPEAVTPAFLNDRGVAMDTEVIKTDDDPGDFTLIFNNRLI
ncbi:hypothetical protein [Asticcacaulis machinosus]|uniref:Uncharacterized protein n=1 Tax=Asticcacaulis machinosus TaxID=2984211 RepID=A0ABT5HGJ8_9CAUL|nr:hypothetical protein [Asticcacaulis machinosus]MDC7675377.1 hypothetical protein [Asticcacaulis machinosus]